MNNIKEMVKIKWFGNKVDPKNVYLPIDSTHQHDRHPTTNRAQSTDKGDAVEMGHMHVTQDKGRRLSHGQLKCRETISGHSYVIALVFEETTHGIDKGALVVCNEDLNAHTLVLPGCRTGAPDDHAPGQDASRVPTAACATVSRDAR
jgi:hypothetical protein